MTHPQNRRNGPAAGQATSLHSRRVENDAAPVSVTRNREKKQSQAGDSSVGRRKLANRPRRIGVCIATRRAINSDRNRRRNLGKNRTIHEICHVPRRCTPPRAEQPARSLRKDSCHRRSKKGLRREVAAKPLAPMRKRQLNWTLWKCARPPLWRGQGRAQL